MIVAVDLEAGASVSEPEDLTSFHVVSASGDDAVVGAAMGEAGHPAGDGDVWVSASWIKQEVASRVSDTWSASFDSMMAYAASKGWLSDGGHHIKAHIETE